jgi:hypothetical protein
MAMGAFFIAGRLWLRIGGRALRIGRSEERLCHCLRIPGLSIDSGPQPTAE